MNLTKMIVVSICSLSLATTAIAADPKASKDLGPSAAETELIGLGWRVSKLKGEDVYNDTKEKVGDIDDFIVTKDGHLVFAIVNIGGFLGYGDYKVAVPVERFSQIVPKAILPGASKEKLRQLPKFDYRILVGTEKGKGAEKP
jgi:sporulation protein YlmC with PRC-barrel domain